MITDTEARINALGKRYNELTGYSLKHRGVCNPRAPAWARFINEGYTERDLELVIRALVRREVPRGMIGFGYLIENLHHFEEELNRARAERRNARPVVSSRDKALGQLRPGAKKDALEGPRSAAKPIGHWIEAMKKAAKGNDQ